VAKDGEEFEGMTKEELKSIFGQIGQYIKQQGEVLNGVRQELAALKEGGEGGGGGDNLLDDNIADPPKEVNLEELSRGDLVKHIVNVVTKEAVAPVRNEMRADRDNRTHADLVTQVNTANDTHPDFGKWHDEIRALTKAHPTMNVEEAYQLARTKDPAKTQDIDAELTKAAEAQAVKERENRVDNLIPVEFGGLLPTSGISSPKGDGEMDPKAAGEAAWDATKMGEHLSALSE